ncbi:MAG: type I-U CRISPR-associated protein Cas5/Cas6, partial [Archangium sp.]|nr:type I-U CRISPR-associated protein Cas5/Cas6 [Archangium sp.]
VRPLRLDDRSPPTAQYTWSIRSEDEGHAALVAELAPSVVALGWGVDLVAGHGHVVATAEGAPSPEGHQRWTPLPTGLNELRTPTAGTFDDLERRHQASLVRTSLAEGAPFNPPPPLAVFARQAYAHDGEAPGRRFAALTFMDPEADRFKSYDTVRRGAVAAGQFRHAAEQAALRSGRPDAEVRHLVMGHGEGTSRFLFMPLPSIEPRGSGETVGSIRRVLITSTDLQSDDVAWLARALEGHTLIDEKQQRPAAVLAEAPRSDRTVARYVAASSEWVTVTPVVLPGHDDPGGVLEQLKKKPPAAEQRKLLLRLDRRRDALLRKALRQAGFPDELVFNAHLEFRATGFMAGCDLVDRYFAPSHLAGHPRLHVKLRWRGARGEPVAVRGPICVGRGRFSGMGLFVSVP